MFRRVDIASLVFFRIAFGVVLALEAWRYLSSGKVRRQFAAPEFKFQFQFFEWVEPWFGEHVWLLFVLVGVCGLLVAAGLFFRAALVTSGITFAYLFLLDYSNYLNHWYLIVLVHFLLLWTPAGRCFSLDARLRPGRRTDFAPAWSVWILRAQLLIVYFFAGASKLNPDWLAGQPMHIWLVERAETSIFAPLFTQLWVAWVASWIGIGIDLFAAPLILWRPTRIPAFLAVSAFHFANHYLLTIGIFAIFMLPATTILLPPDWPRRVLAALSRPSVPASRAPRAPAGASPAGAGSSSPEAGRSRRSRW